MPSKETITQTDPLPSEMELELTTQVLGSGSFSKVLLARNTKTSELLAAKIVDLKTSRKYYNREVKALTTIHHKANQGNVVPLVQYGEDEENGYIFTPYVRAGTLADYVNSKGRLRELEALEILDQIVEGVDSVHKAGISHSDLKPENILYDPVTKKATIFDFGLSLEMDKDNNVNECCGSPLYMAPEVILRKRHNAVLSDIWSLGVIFYYLLFADFPWYDVDDIEDLIDAILNDVITFPRLVCDEVSSLLLRMLDRDPLKRPRMDTLKEMLKGIITKIKSSLLGLVLQLTRVPTPR